MKKDESDYIGKMLEETYRFLPRSDVSQPSQDLLSYYKFKQGIIDVSTFLDVEKKLNELGAIFFKIQYVAGIQCYRLMVQHEIYDFPSNWSLFARIREYQESAKEGFVKIASLGEKDPLRVVFGQLVRDYRDQARNVVIFTVQGKCWATQLQHFETRFWPWLEENLNHSQEFQVAA